MDDEQPFTMHDAAVVLQCSRKRLLELIDDGRLAYRRTPKGHRIMRRVDVETLAAELAPKRAARQSKKTPEEGKEQSP
jgi:hypothetical protein